MPQDKGKKLVQSEIYPGERLWDELRQTVEEVARYLALPAKGVVSLKLSYRGENDWLAVMKRYNEEDKVEVVFGSGASWVACLIGLEVAIEQNKWRLDRWANKS